MTIVCSRCGENHSRDECNDGVDRSWSALMATKEAYRQQAHRLAAENAELRAQVEQEIKNWKARNRSACEAEQEVVRLNQLLAERDWLVGELMGDPQMRREAFERIVASIEYDGSDTNGLTVGEIRRALPASSTFPSQNQTEN